ncbi:molybdopterin molybdochelatase [Nitrobacter winogradskyi Nb-255]|uniref:Molybdopterin molybdenumtransferase n=1 Tax=Nitrobacter winogradskyi (strain ATCC 25391 / DSM 10237 / CIP 104748 / NCIMB 11846 / Nb-255) TaxID=323098 RepID=Q3SRJ1_NITWN|nr:gephyrin-like molybdotransferase Glp [Nitrobacter winogradskyi]ABA05100.1 molybdopterin molybdochelatase [Nitrobacter winogradskyi Nb-255]
MALMAVADALAAVLDGVEPLPEETAALEAAHRRVLARDLPSRRTQPPVAMSAMDGYAVRAADIATIPSRLRVIGESAAGRPLDRALRAGEALRIFTGGVVPDGADTVVIQEDTDRDGDHVIVKEATASGKNIRPAGVDFREGDVLIRARTRLTDRHLSLAAGMNYPDLPVHRRPTIAMLATGDELVLPGATPGPGQIILSNGYALRALARGEGAEAIDLGLAADTMDATTAAIRRARDSGADILVTTGGASVGDHDFIKRALEAEGVEMTFWRIAMRPGKPMMYGRLGAMRVIGLPGNPVSAYICAFLFMVPLIRALSGRVDVHHRVEPALLGGDVAANQARQDYLRARLTYSTDGLPIATPVTHQDSSLMGNLAAADALVVRAPFAPAASKGAPCTVIKLSLS